MTSQLLLSVRLLNGRYHGDDWPPSPARLFQALAAGANAGCRTLGWPRARAALAWLERQEPPAVIAPPAGEGFAYKSFAPNNDSDARGVVALVREGRGLSEAMRAEGMITTKHHAPRLLEESDEAVIHYLWSLPPVPTDEDRSQAQEVCRLARYLLALGWGVDTAVGDGELRSSDAPWPVGQRYIHSWLGGSTILKTPAPGFLDDLERAYGAFRGRALGGGAVDADTRPRSHRPVPYRLADRAPGRFAVAFDLLDVAGEERRSFRWEEGMHVAAWMRHAAKERFLAEGWPEERVNAYVCGHTAKGEESRRLSYVPLPSIGHQHSDGHHRRALVVLPFDDENAEESLAILYRMAGDPLKPTSQSKPLAWLSEARRDKVFDRYLTESIEWMSVTPIVLHGRDWQRGRFQPRKAEKLLLQAFVESGYPAEQIVEFSYQPAPYWRGPGSTWQASVPQHLSQWPRYHVRVVFRNPVAGPVLAGIGRHYGLGVFATAQN